MATDTFHILQQQIAAKPEASAGVVETLAAADVTLRTLQGQTSFTPEFNRFANDEVADDLGQAPDFVAGKAGRIGCGFICKTSGVVGTPPAIGKFLRACGCKQQAVRQITIGAPTGGDSAFTAGDAWTSGAKSGIVENTISGAGAFRYVLNTGSSDLVATDVVTSSGDTATASGTTSAYATKYTPRSTGLETLTIQRGIKNFNGTSAQDFLQRLRGAMGNFTLDLASLDVGRMNFDFAGVVDAMAAGSLLTGIAYESSVAKPLINSTITLNGVLVRPSAIQFDAGVQVEMEPDPTTDGGTSGYFQAYVSRREPKLTIDPFRLKPGTLDDLGLLSAGTEIPIIISWGTTPNLIEFCALKAQVREDSEGNRANLVVPSLTLHITRNTVLDDEWEIYFR